MFDSLDEQGDGEVGRDELLASLDCDHPHVMALLRGTPANSNDRGDVWGSEGGGAGGAGIGPAILSVFDALEANDDEFIGWDEVRNMSVCISREREEEMETETERKRTRGD